MIFGKALVRLFRASRNAHYFSAGGDIVFPPISDGTQLPRADWSFISGIEQKHYYLAAMVRQSPFDSIAVAEAKVWRRLSFLSIRSCHASIMRSIH
jgi:hypothetical protein